MRNPNNGKTLANILFESLPKITKKQKKKRLNNKINESNKKY